MKRLTVFAVAAAAFAGCVTKPESHHGTENKVFNFDQAIDEATKVLEHNFNTIESTKKDGRKAYIRTSYEIRKEADQKIRTYAEATLTQTDDNVAIVDVIVIHQKDESDNGYGEHSESNPKWGVETHDMELEKKIVDQIDHNLRKAWEERK